MAQELSPAKSPKSKSVTPPVGAPPVPEKAAPEKKGGSGLLYWLMFLVLLAGAGVVGWHFYGAQGQAAADGTSASGSGKGKHAGADISRVVTAKATLGDIGDYLTGLGAVTPLNTVTVKSRVDGQLMKVLFQEGQMVKEGDLLIQLDDRPFQAQVAQFKAQQEHDQALLDNAKIDLERYQTLWKQDSIPQQTLATQEALVKQDQGTVDSDQAQIDTAQLNVTYCNITAPISGRIGLRLVDQGNQVHAADTNGLLVITQVQPITVVFTIPEDNIQPVLDKLNTAQSLSVDAYSRDGFTTKLATGTLLTTDNQIDQTTGTLKLKAVFPNTHNELFPNQFVNTRLLVDMKKDVTLIPVSAIQYGTQGTFVYIVNPADPATDPASPPAPDATASPSPDGTAPGKPARAMRTVKLQNVVIGIIDKIDGNLAEVVSGVSPGDIVVTDGVDKLQDGSKVILADPTAGGGAGSKKHGGKKAGATTASTDGSGS